MSIFQEKAIVRQLEQLSEENFLLTLFAPATSNGARPGQFVMVGVGAANDPLLRRPFSINSVDKGGQIRLLFKVVGRGTRILSQTREGDLLPLLGPLGTGFAIDPDKQACLVGGGMGIAPMRFLAEYLQNCQDRTVMDTVILGGRNRDELEPLVGDFDGLDMTVLMVTDDGSFGDQGLVTDILGPLKLGSDTIVYSCGPKPMLYAVYQCSQKKGLSCQVSIESVMACGMGACLGCSVPAFAGGYLHVCTDGPVFDAEKLVWSI